MRGVHLWMRHEVRETERRAPIVPDDARELVRRGVTVTVERSPRRVFAADDYASGGCRIVPAGAWVDAPDQAYIIGLKELPDTPAALRHRHVFFGHAYKGQAGGAGLLRRFAAGGGTLLDVEYLVDDGGRRLAAFGYWAGYVGAALAVLVARGGLDVPLRPVEKDELDLRLRATTPRERLTALVIGALGRSGQGARAALATAGIEPTCWDVEETRRIDRAALLRHRILVNTVLSTGPVEPFVTPADLTRPDRATGVVCDVTCDVGSPFNAIPIYDATTTWDQPVRRIAVDPSPLDLIAIDNLPSLLPREASTAFSAELLPLLLALGQATRPWRDCARAFEAACRVNGIAGAVADV